MYNKTNEEQMNCEKSSKGNGIQKNVQQRPLLTPKQKKTRLQWAKEKQLWTVDDWMKGICSDELQICIGQGDDAGTFVWCRSYEIYKDNCLKKTCRLAKL